MVYTPCLRKIFFKFWSCNQVGNCSKTCCGGDLHEGRRQYERQKTFIAQSIKKGRTLTARPNAFLILMYCPVDGKKAPHHFGGGVMMPSRTNTGYMYDAPNTPSFLGPLTKPSFFWTSFARSNARLIVARVILFALWSNRSSPTRSPLRPVLTE